MQIRSKLMLSAVVSISALVAMFALQQYSANVQQKLSIAATSVMEIEKEIFSLRKEEKDLLSRLDVKYIDKHQQNSADLVTLFGQMEQVLNDRNIPTNALDGVRNSVNLYLDAFKDIVNLQKEIGLHPKQVYMGN